MSEIITGDSIKFINGKELKITPVDARTLNVDVSSVAYLEEKKDMDNNIISVDLEGKYTLDLTSQIAVRVGKVESLYEVKYIIISSDRKSILLLSSKPTKTSTFLLPLLGKNKKALKFNSYYVNAYLDETHKRLCLLYRFTGTDLYKQFEESIMKDTLCVSHEEYDPYHVIYVFNIPEKHHEDVKHFLNGAYSKFSEALKRAIWKFYGQQDGTMVMSVVSRSKDLRREMEKLLGTKLAKEAELASKPDMEIEIYKIKQNG